MGWIFKGFLAVVALILLGAGLWLVSLLIVGYLLFSLRPRRERVQRAVLVTPREGEREQLSNGRGGTRVKASRFRWHWRYAVGGVLLILALIAMGAKGTYAPLVFGGASLLCLFWGTVGGANTRFAPTSSLSPVRESILLTPRALPFVWVALVEIKLSSQEAARALGVLRDDLIVTSSSSERPRVFLVLRQIALSRRGAETKVAERLRRLGAILASRGAYVLPLDGLQVVEKFQHPLEPEMLDLDDSIVAMVGHSQYDVLVVRPQGSRVKALGAYTRVSQREPGALEALLAGSSQPEVETVAESSRAILPGPRQKLESEPLLWEVISSLQERIVFSEPDSSTMLLNNMHLSRTVPLAHKMNLLSGSANAEEKDGTVVTVESLGGTPVELSRVQLRAIVKIYG